jgi:DNA-binding MurR/RpiR family transcriptional regulator
LDQAAALTWAAQRIVLVGEGASSGIAVVAMDILFTLGRPAAVIENERTGAYFLTSNPRDLMLLAISHSGETQFPTRTVREARERGFKTIALTNEPASELARLAHVVLPTQVVESARGRYAIAPRICQLAVLDQLFDRLTGARSGAQAVTRRE